MHRIRVLRLIAAFGVGLLAAGGPAVILAADAQQLCTAAKNKAAGRYASCRERAAAKLAKTGDGTRYSSAISKCQLSFSTQWQKAIDKAAAQGTTCFDAPLTAGDFDGVIASHTDNVKTALAGGGLVQDCPSDLASCRGNLGACEAAQQGQLLKTGQTACYAPNPHVPFDCAGTGQDGELQQGLARSYTDNGDGTITDNRTGLMWEKQSHDFSIHDSNGYTWSAAFGKAAALNSASFAGHTDWRLPSINELQSLVNYDASPTVHAIFNTACVPGCSVTTCSCARECNYWSSTTVHDNPSYAWNVSFSYGFVDAYDKGTGFCVRAVRLGP